MRFNIRDIVVTMVITLFLCFFWQAIELFFYGKVEPRIVDDIIMLIMIPFIYFATKK